MAPKINGSDIQLLVIYPYYKTVKGKEKFIKEHFLKVWMSRSDIGAYGEFVGSKGEVLKTRIQIYNSRTGQYSTVAHSLEEMEKSLQKKVVGY